ncbi:hypothetical protein B1H38_03820 [Leptospira borgpetersenii serovar Ballum]|uniref:Uncharacterized protein n=2 Tax=Leptospira borgpetersenii TaxID=174 RepID=M3FA75_LEPBO|nr:hypothetical protein LEP1GSC123_3048 [Leptospira borgpetersenii str. 200701203]OOV45827.1 hypothetical protein B1H38_03820 [Leptospira borgpetersenii serovar Ballum]
MSSIVGLWMIRFHDDQIFRSFLLENSFSRIEFVSKSQRGVEWKSGRKLPWLILVGNMLT